MTRRKHADYIYRNADDSMRFKVFRTDAGWWEIDYFDKETEEVWTFSEMAGDVHDRKRDALQHIKNEYGRIYPLGDIPDVTYGWY